MALEFFYIGMLCSLFYSYIHVIQIFILGEILHLVFFLLKDVKIFFQCSLRPVRVVYYNFCVENCVL
jgi:hypothetical protein